MEQEKKTQLTDALYEQLQSETLILLHTIDAEHGYPTSSAISWACATDRQTVRFALDQRSRLVTNLEQNAHVGLTTFRSGTIFSIKGNAAIVGELTGVPFNMVYVDVAIDTVQEAMFYGSRITVHPEFEKIYDSRAAEKLDKQVFSALKKA